MNLWRITFRYSGRADYTAVENVGYAQHIREWLNANANAVSPELLSVKATQINGADPGWEWLNPYADDANPRHRVHVVSAAAQGV